MHRLVVVAFLTFCVAGASQGATGRAVSLRFLQERIKSGDVDRENPKSVTRLCGVTRIMGYIADPKCKDIILIGKVDTGKEPLYLDDFVVALRNAHLKYAEKKGSTTYFTAPTCSIDPRPETLSKLYGIGGRIFGLSDEKALEQLKADWCKVCSSQQDVTVSGVPHHSRFASVMVEADYRLKKYVDGIDSLPQIALESHADMILRQCELDYQNNRPLSVSPTMMNRFWLAPGKNHMIERGNAILVKTCTVELMTESEMLRKSGARRKTGSRDPLADKYARRFTFNYNKISSLIRVYSQLETLYRFAFIAKVMNMRDAAARAGADISFLIDSHVLEDIEVTETVPGVPNFCEAKAQRETEKGYAVAHFRLPSCGGVTMNIAVDRNTVIPDQRREIAKLHKHVVQARPEIEDTVSWDFEIDWDDE